MTADQIENGSVWQCKFPQCWRVMVQFITADQWLLLSSADDRAPFMVHHTIDYGPILTREQAAAWLTKLEAVRVLGGVYVLEYNNGAVSIGYPIASSIANQNEHGSANPPYMG